MPKLMWMPASWTRYFIDGHNARISDVGRSLEDAIKMKFPPNGIPQEVYVALSTLTGRLQGDEERLQALLELVQEYLEEE